MAAALKDLPARVQVSGVRHRQVVVGELTRLLEQHQLQEPVVKGICKVLILTLPRYQVLHHVIFISVASYRTGLCVPVAGARPGEAT